MGEMMKKGKSKSKATTSLSRLTYRATAMFGGVQGVNIVGSLIRTKLVAVWVGEIGVGLFGLMNAAVDLLVCICSLGLRSGAVRELGAESEMAHGNVERRLAVVSRLSMALAIAGVVITLLLSPILSENIYNNYTTIWPIALLALTVGLGIMAEGRRAMLQGTQRLAELARASVWGVALGCVISVPVIYWLRVQSVAPVILIYGVTVWGALYLSSLRIAPSIKMKLAEAMSEGREMITIGVYIMLSGLAAYGTQYLFISYINNVGGTAVAGCFQAGYTLSVKYVGFLFAAIGMEYFPRLSGSAAHGSRRMSVFVRHEAVTLLPLVSVASCAMALLAPYIIRLLYSSEFLSATPMVVLAAPGVVLRAVSWCVAFSIIAAGHGGRYMICECVSAAVGLALGVAGYEMWGLAGVGLSYSVWYLVYTLIVCFAARRDGVTIGWRVGALTALSTALAVGVAYLSVL